MDTKLIWIIGAGLVGGIISISCAAAISMAALTAWVPRMVSYAVGVMLAAAFLHLLPEAFMQADSVEGLFALTLAGLLGFFLLEKVAIWRHRHDHGRGSGSHTHAGMMIIVGDGFHNFVDGVLIAAAFLTDVNLGVATTLAIIAHEVPQEVGDFMVLLHSGYSRRTALLLNFASSLACVAGGIAGFYALTEMQQATQYVLVLAAASFIYISVADLIPDLHRASDTRSTLWQVALIAAGMATIAAPHWLFHAH